MSNVKRTITYPDGRVVEEFIDMKKHKVTKKKVSKPDDVESKPKEERKPFRKAYTTTSSSEQ